MYLPLLVRKLIMMLSFQLYVPLILYTFCIMGTELYTQFWN